MGDSARPKAPEQLVDSKLVRNSAASPTRSAQSKKTMSNVSPTRRMGQMTSTMSYQNLPLKYPNYNYLSTSPTREGNTFSRAPRFDDLKKEKAKPIVHTKEPEARSVDENIQFYNWKVAFAPIFEGSIFFWTETNL